MFFALLNWIRQFYCTIVTYCYYLVGCLLYWKPDHGSLGGENQGTRVLMVDFSKDNILVTLKEVLLLSQMV